MTAVYASTTPEWFRRVAQLTPGADAAFWQPTSGKPKRITAGERWFFKELGRPYIVGSGSFVRHEQMELGELYRRYGPGTGYDDLGSLVAALAQLRSDGTATASTVVGNIVLRDIQQYSPEIALSDVGLENLTAAFRYVVDGPLSTGEHPAFAATSAGTESGEQGSLPSQGQDAAGRPTDGPPPTDGEHTVSRTTDTPASAYAFQFGEHDIWKIGWAKHVGKRLAMVNKHIPLSIFKAKWRHSLTQDFTNHRAAFSFEQDVLQILARYRTEGEMVACTSDQLRSAWASAVNAKRVTAPHEMVR